MGNFLIVALATLLCFQLTTCSLLRQNQATATTAPITNVNSFSNSVTNNVVVPPPASVAPSPAPTYPYGGYYPPPNSAQEYPPIDPSLYPFLFSDPSAYPTYPYPPAPPPPPQPQPQPNNLTFITTSSTNQSSNSTQTNGTVTNNNSANNFVTNSIVTSGPASPPAAVTVTDPMAAAIAAAGIAAMNGGYPYTAQQPSPWGYY